MTFLNSYILWFLPAVLLPIIIHLLSKRKATRVDFSSLRFLKALEQDALKTFNIKQLILLILRTLLVLFLILAFARPTIQKGVGFQLATRPQTLTLVVVDNTASTRTILNSDRFQDWIKDLSALSTQQSDLYFLGLGDSVLSKAANDIEPTWSGPVVENIAQFAADHLPTDAYARRECILITDGQITNTALDSLMPWWTAVLLFPGEPDQGITSITFPGHVFQPGDEYPIRAQVFTNKAGMEDEPVELWINDRRMNQILLNTTNRDHENFELKGLIEGRKSQEGILKLSPDANPYNDSRYFVIQPGNQIQVGVVTPAQQPNIWEILKTVLAQQAYNIGIDIADVNNLDALELARVKTIIWDTNIAVSSYQLERFRQFVTDGNQMIMVGAINPTISRAFDIPKSTKTETDSYGYPIHLTRNGASVFQEIPLNATIENGRLVVKKRFISDTPLKKSSKVWLAFADETPLLSVTRHGLGQIVWLNTTLNPTDSNWPVLGVFPAMLVKMIYMAVPELDVNSFNRVVGESLRFPRLEHFGTEPLQIQIPGGQSQFIQPDSTGNLVFSEASQPGFYRLFQGAQQLSSIAVNVDSREAQPQSLTPGESFLGRFNLNLNLNLAGDQDLTQQILANRQGIPLWPWLLLLALVVFFCENLVARIPRGWRQ